MNDSRAGSERKAIPVGLAALLVGAVVAVAVGLLIHGQAESRGRVRAERALRLQLLASRLGAATILAEFGDYDEARTLMSGVFDGIRNYGIEVGAIPENYATVLGSRDSVTISLDRRSPAVTPHLIRLFFRLQLPIETGLDPKRIIPATDSGGGIAPPTRLPPSGEVDSLGATPRGAPADSTARR